MRIASTEDLARYVRERRQSLDLTQSQLASRAGVSRRWLSAVEAGKPTVEFGLVIRTLHALRVVLDLQPEEATYDFDLDAYLRGFASGSRPTPDRDVQS